MFVCRIALDPRGNFGTMHLDGGGRTDTDADLPALQLDDRDFYIFAYDQRFADPPRENQHAGDLLFVMRPENSFRLDNRRV
jgi:hypothetical protein